MTNDSPNNPNPTSPDAQINEDTRQQIYQTATQVIKEQLQYGLTPSEVVDMIAVEKAGLSQTEWADTRDVEQSTISGNIAQARDKITSNRLDAEVAVTDDKVTVTVSDKDGETHDLPFNRETTVIGYDGSPKLELVYEAFSSIHGYYVDEDGREFEASLWRGGQPANTFDDFDKFDEWGQPKAKADVVLWDADNEE